MLELRDLHFLFEHAYLPEHLPGYVGAVGDGEPDLQDHHLCLHRRSHLTFIGYPLGDNVTLTAAAYEALCDRFRPQTVAIIAPELWLPPEDYELRGSDSYYRLLLPCGPPAPEVAYMVGRAERELTLAYGTFSQEHKKLVKAFVATHNLSPEQKRLYGRITGYLKGSPSAHLIEARKGGCLVAFSVVDTGSKDYAFFMFHFRSPRTLVPGASDLLFSEMIRLAESEGKSVINLGLGIHPGIRRFKEKWGGTPFLSYASALVRKQPLCLGRLADKL